MREILFRGKRYDDGSWVEGYLIHDETCNTHIPYIGYLFDGGHDIDVAEIILGTVGQFTGLTDKNGKKIFEGDIVRDEYYSFAPIVGVVTFGTGTFDSGIYKYTGWHLQDRDGHVDHNELQVYNDNGFVVIGNIHDNPELLEVEENG